MKKPAKPAKKAAKPAPKKAAAKKPAAKPAAKKPAAKPVAKKPVVKAKVASKPVAKKPAGKPAPKSTGKKPVITTKKADIKGKSQSSLQKKIQDKIAASKNKSMKKEAFNKKTSAKKVEVKAKAEKTPKIDKAALKLKEKAAAKASKEAQKLAAKNAKEAEKLAAKTAKEAAKAPKKLSKKEEKELLKLKGKKGSSFEEDELEEGSSKRSEDDEEEDDFVADTPKKVKMTFDEDIEEEIIPVRKKKSAIDDDIKENLAEEILALSEDFSIEDVFGSIRSMELFKVESDECVVRGCDNPSTTSGYCRYHYIKLWKDVKKKQIILSEGRLAKIIEELVRKYPMKYIETIIQDLADDKAFNHVLKDLDIETDEAEIDGFDDDEVLDDDQDIAFETKVVKPSFDD